MNNYPNSKKYLEDSFRHIKIHSLSKTDYRTAITLYEMGKDEEDKHNLKEAFDNYLQSANIGNSLAQKRLSYLYKEGIGTNKDLEQSNFWYSEFLNNEYRTIDGNSSDNQEQILINPNNLQNNDIGNNNESHVSKSYYKPVNQTVATMIFIILAIIAIVIFIFIETSGIGFFLGVIFLYVLLYAYK